MSQPVEGVQEEERDVFVIGRSVVAQLLLAGPLDQRMLGRKC